MSTKEIHPTMQRIYDATSLNGSDLAASINESPQTIYKWDKRGVSKKGAFAISQKHKIDIGWILTGDGDPRIESISRNTSNAAPMSGGWVPVKSYSKMGYDGFYTEMGFLGNGGDGYVPSLTAGPNAYAVKGTGDSMYPAIRSGWYIVCDPDATPTPTEFVEVRLNDGRRTIKELIGVVGGLLHLLSVNGEKRMTFELSEVDAIIAVTDIVPPSRHVQEYPTMQIKNITYE